VIESRKPSSVLLVGDAYYGAIAAVRALRAAGYSPWLAVDEPGAYANRSRARAGTVVVSSPRFDGERFVRELADAATRLSVAAVLPGAEPYLLTLAGHETDFPGIALGVPPRKIVERATDKESLTKVAAAVGLQTPPTEKVVRGNNELVGTFGFPAIVKPRHTWIQNMDGTVSTYSARYISADQVEQATEHLPDGGGLVQPYIPGQLIGVAGVSWEGRMICALHQASIRIWPARSGGSSYAETIPPNLELERGVSRLVQTIGWSGLFQAQFIRSSRGEHYLIDFNPRVYGSLALAVAAGLNLPGIWADLLLGRRPEVGGYRVGTRYRHEEFDARSLAWMLLRGEGLGALRGFMPRRNTTHAIFSLRDPMPLLTSVTTLARRLRR
jgi:predicted ATP-grasp superfamily ATP-dependent carboligase